MWLNNGGGLLTLNHKPPAREAVLSGGVKEADDVHEPHYSDPVGCRARSIRWFPGRVFNTIVGASVPLVGPTPPQGYLAALGAALLWIVGFVVASAIVFPRQDVNA